MQNPIRLDIISLINNSPITTISNEYQTKLLTKVQDTFTNEQQRLFVASFYCYLHHNSKNDFVISLDDVWKWIGFGRQDDAKKSLKKYFKLDIDYIIEKAAPPAGGAASSSNKLGGAGLNKEKALMTINTFKKFCLKANTKKADEIHDYYIKLEELLQETMNEEALGLKKEIKELEQDKTQLIKEKELERHNILLREFAIIGSLVYVIKVKSFEDGTYIVRIGESRKGVLNRWKDHKSNYTEAVILDCFLVNRSSDFEKYIHTQIKDNKVKDLEGHTNENELFLIGKELSYGQLLNIINTNINNFNNNNDNELLLAKLEIDKLTKMNEILKSGNFDDLCKVLNMNSYANLLNKIENLENQNTLILNKLNENTTKRVNNFQEPLKTVGPKLQKINPETLQLVKVYETVAECLKENPKMKRPSINKAVVENTIYNCFRWLLVGENLDANVIHKIEKTKPTRMQNMGYIAKLDKDKTRILNVYLDRKSASSLNNYPYDSSLDNPVRSCSLSNGNYYILYDKCSEELRENFEIQYGEPVLYKSGIGQYNSDNVLLKEFTSKVECCRMLGIGDKTVKKALEHKIAYQGFYYQYLPIKLKMC